eukprot:gene15180-biopygen11200
MRYEETAAPQALPGARTCKPTTLCSVLFCSAMFCSVLFCSALPNPTKPTQTNTTAPQHHTTVTQWGLKCKTASKAPVRTKGNGAEGTGELKNRRRRRRDILKI